MNRLYKSNKYIHDLLKRLDCTTNTLFLALVDRYKDIIAHSQKTNLDRIAEQGLSERTFLMSHSDNGYVDSHYDNYYDCDSTYFDESPAPKKKNSSKEDSCLESFFKIIFFIIMTIILLGIIL